MVVELIIFAFLIIAASGSALHGPCEGNEQCGTLDTYCKNGTCACKDDFIVLYDHCIQLATPHITCTHKSSCSTVLGQKGFCKSHQCACKSFHHLHNHQCVKSRALFETCDNHHQCYCGQDCKDKIGCTNGTCICKVGFKMNSRRCITDPHFVDLSRKQGRKASSASSLNTYFTPRLLTLILFIRKLHYLY